MSITIANMIAQIGTDLTQFKIGMNEVDARLHLVAVREKEAAARIQGYRQKQAMYIQDADLAAQKRMRLGASNQNIQGIINKEAAELISAKAKLQTAAAGLQAAVAAQSATGMTQFTKEVKTAQAEVKKLEASIKSANGKLGGNNDAADALRRRESRLRYAAAESGRRAVAYDEEGQALREVARRYAARLAQNANEHRIRAANAVSSIAQNGGLLIGGALAAADKVGNDLNQKMVTTGHNTSLNTEGIASMNRDVKKMGLESGADLNGLADSYRKIENYGYGAADSTKILGTAMKASVAYGSDMAETTDVLVKELKEFNIPATEADRAMNVMITTAKKSSQTLGELTHVYGNMSAYSANLGVSLIETSAAFITMTRHGLNAADAATQFKNDINRIINPSAKVVTALGNIKKATGVDLVKDFSEEGLRVRKLTGIWQDFNTAAEKYRQKGGIYKNVTAAGLAAKAFPMQRGQLGGVIATGTGFKDWALAMDELKKASAGGVDLNRDYNESLKQTNQQLERLKNAAIIASASVSAALAPSIQKAINVIDSFAKSFNDLSDSQKGEWVTFAGTAAAVLLIVGVIGKAIVAINALNQAVIQMGVTNGILGTVKAGWTALSASVMAMTLSTGVWIATAVIAAGLIVYIIKALNDKANAEEENRKATVDATNANINKTRSDYTASLQLGDLMTRYTELKAQTHHTTAQTKEMHSIMDRIAQLSPSLVSGYNAQGHAIGLIGSAADQTTTKLATMAAQARAASIASQNLDLAGMREQRNALQAKLDSEHLFQSGFSGAPPPQSLARAAALRAQINPLDQKIKDTQGQINTAFVMPNTAQQTRSRSTEYLTQDLSLMTDRLNKATNALVEFDRANASNPEAANVSRRSALQLNVETAKKQTKMLKDELDVRKNVAAQLAGGYFGENAKPGIPGEDALGHLYDKDKKGKKAKKSDEEKEKERMDDAYEKLIESARQKQYESLNLNPEATNAEEVKNRWETIAHGMLTVDGAAKQLKGTFFDMNSSSKAAIVSAGQLEDQLRRTMEINNKIRALEKANRDAAIGSMRDEQGKAPTAMQAEQLKYNYGDYDKEYGSQAKRVFGDNMSRLRDEHAAHIADSTRKFETIDYAPVKEGMEVYDKVLKEIMADTELYNVKGDEWAKTIAKQHQAASNATEQLKKYNDVVDDAKIAMMKMKAEDKEGGATKAEILAIELQGKAYVLFTQKQKDKILSDYKELAAQEKLNEAHSTARQFMKELNEEVDKSATLVMAARDPKGARWHDFHQNAVGKMEKEYKDMSPDQKVTAEAQIKQAFDKIEAYNAEAKSAEKVAEIMREVSESTDAVNGKLKINTDKWKINSDAIKVSTKDWATLSKEQQDKVSEFVKMSSVKQQIQGFLDGLQGVFSKTLENIHEHGFKNFFKDVIGGFDDMLFQLAEKWATSQFMQMLQGGFGAMGGTPGIAGGGGGGSLGGLLGTLFGGHGGGGMFMPGVDLGATAVSNADLFTNPLAGVLGLDGALADGGPVTGGGTYLVGENGPELFRSNTNGRITNNNDLQSMGGGNTVHVHVHGVTTPAAFIQSTHQIAQGVTRALAAAQKR